MAPYFSSIVASPTKACQCEGRKYKSGISLPHAAGDKAVAGAMDRAAASHLSYEPLNAVRSELQRLQQEARDLAAALC